MEKYFGELMEFDDFIPRDPQSNSIPFARGGPVVVPYFVSPVTSVPQFFPSSLCLLEDLEAAVDRYEDYVDEVDDLKVLTEDDFLEMAFKESEDASGIKVQSPSRDNCYDNIPDSSNICDREIVCSETPAIDSCSSETSPALADLTIVPCDRKSDSDNKLQPKTGKKRGRVCDGDSQAAELEQDSFFSKVNEVVKLKHQQNEDKLAAKLRSFRNFEPIPESIADKLERIRRMSSLRFTSSMKVKPSTCKEHAPLSSPEVIICVEIYHKKKSCTKGEKFMQPIITILG